MRVKLTRAVKCLLVIATLALASPSSYGGVIYETDFEAPTFTTGPLHEQDDWFVGIFWRTAFMVTDEQPASGSQSVRIAGTYGERFGGGFIEAFTERVLNYDALANNTPVIEIAADVRLDGPSTDTGSGTLDDVISASVEAYVSRSVPMVHFGSFRLSSSGEGGGDRPGGEEYGIEAPIQLGQYYNLALQLDFARRQTDYLLNGRSVGVVAWDPTLTTSTLGQVGLWLVGTDRDQYTAYFDNFRIATVFLLEPGDANQDQSFDQLDLVEVLQADKYLTGQPATWGEGDWDGGPGGEPGNPPAGDGVFDQLDVISALASGVYLTGPYAAVQPNGQPSDNQTSIVYHASTGELAVDAPASTELTSINIDSAEGIFTADPTRNLGGSFDNDSDTNVFKATFGSSFGSLSFGNIAHAGLSHDFLLSDLTVIGSLAGGGDLGDVDLIYIPVPEPSGIVLLGLGLASIVCIVRPPRTMFD